MSRPDASASLARSGTSPATDAQQPPAAPRRRRTPRVPYALLVPSIGILVLALGYPLVWQVLTSLQKFGLAQQFGKPPEFVGLRNYLDLATDPYLWTVVARSVAFCLVNAGVTVLVGVLVALLM